ncbi:hypothetical protein EQV97_22585 [Pseudomonas sp. TMW22090]|uniref:hypothetical protein n=1 Tax=Pseudomonas sp. TMW22090 TaxID=2506434 RepID=UPI001F0D8B8F|nr:hypothetical protein [Pseudomonas sp. TMW22090]MCH4880150.1 hypothetical protein [Pseudomonas sp. TMW22090]
MDTAFWANYIAGAALLISVVAAILSWRAVATAKKANQINIHLYQKILYEKFRIAFEQLKKSSSGSMQREFMEFGPHVQSAGIYVSSGLAEDITEFYTVCLNLQESREILEVSKSKLDNAQDPNHVSMSNPISSQEIELAVRNHAKARGNFIYARAHAMELGKKLQDRFIKEMVLV